ncbi:hypothetical protein L1987_01548 [Smallanthus sonchifolius]|uniref:Uncharacterized protein n=1 Tax=Smallanthus sonchifolius TaxID=185202 RepID=A0ACB9K5F3_9ASTR|nr:hypothetical protein L1987_01548 [Smallanthus sonchifolius]
MSSGQRGCLLVRQCYFHNDPRNIISIGGEVLGCRDFHSRFRASQAGLCLNMDYNDSPARESCGLSSRESKC